MTNWQSNAVGDTVYITVSPGHGQHEGTITHISEIGAGGAYPIFTVNVPAYGSFTRPADEVTCRLTVMLHLDVPAVDMPTDVAKEIADLVPSYYTVADWETADG